MKQKEDYNRWAKSAIAEHNWVGQVQKAYGVGGELVIRLGDNFPKDNLGEPLWVEIDSLAVPLFVRSLVSQGMTKAVVVFDDFESEDLAARLLGLKVYSHVGGKVSDEDEQQQGDWGFLVGFSFEDLTSGVKGQVVDCVDNVMNPLLVVEIDSQEHLIPVADELIDKVNERKKILRMKLPEGILNLATLVAVEDEK